MPEIYRRAENRWLKILEKKRVEGEYANWKKSLTEMTRKELVEGYCELDYLVDKVLLYIGEFEKEVSQKVKDKGRQKALPRLKAFREFIIDKEA